jgi:MFS family permease
VATKAHTSKGIVLLLSCAAQFMVVLDIAIVNVALPSIQHDLGIGQSTLQWIVIAYGLILGGFLLLGGRMTAAAAAHLWEPLWIGSTSRTSGFPAEGHDHRLEVRALQPEIVMSLHAGLGVGASAGAMAGGPRAGR